MKNRNLFYGKDFPLVEFGECIESEIVGVFFALSASDNYKILPL